MSRNNSNTSNSIMNNMLSPWISNMNNKNVEISNYFDTNMNKRNDNINYFETSNVNNNINNSSGVTASIADFGANLINMISSSPNKDKLIASVSEIAALLRKGNETNTSNAKYQENTPKMQPFYQKNRINIDNIYQRPNELASSIFVVGFWKWQIIIYLFGNEFDSNKINFSDANEINKRNMSVYVKFLGPINSNNDNNNNSIDFNENIETEFRCTILSTLGDHANIYMEFQHIFSVNNPIKGFANFIPCQLLFNNSYYLFAPQKDDNINNNNNKPNVAMLKTEIWVFPPLNCQNELMNKLVQQMIVQEQSNALFYDSLTQLNNGNENNNNDNNNNNNDNSGNNLIQGRDTHGQPPEKRAKH